MPPSKKRARTDDGCVHGSALTENDMAAASDVPQEMTASQVAGMMSEMLAAVRQEPSNLMPSSSVFVTTALPSDRSKSACARSKARLAVPPRVNAAKGVRGALAALSRPSSRRAHAGTPGT